MFAVTVSTLSEFLTHIRSYKNTFNELLHKGHSTKGRNKKNCFVLLCPVLYTPVCNVCVILKKILAEFITINFKTKY